MPTGVEVEDESCCAHLGAVRHVGVAPHPAVQVCRTALGHANNLVVRCAAEVAPAVGPAGVAVLLVKGLRGWNREDVTKPSGRNITSQHCNMRQGPLQEKRTRCDWPTFHCLPPACRAMQTDACSGNEQPSGVGPPHLGKHLPRIRGGLDNLVMLWRRLEALPNVGYMVARSFNLHPANPCHIG